MLQEYGNEFSVLMLRLEILSSEDSSSCQEYFEGKMAIYPVFGA
jgi:hypothetical protein